MCILSSKSYFWIFTNAIHYEWIRNLLKERPDLDSIALLRTRQLMDRVVPDCLIESYESLIQGLALPDPDDRHVWAAIQRISKSICAPANAVIPVGSKGGETSTTSPPATCSPLRP